MAGLTIAKVENPNAEDAKAGDKKPSSQIKLTPLATAATVPVVIASIVAIAGAVQPFFSTTLEDRLKRAVEEAKLEAGQRDLASEWMKAALAIDDAAERGKAVRFIAKAGLLPGTNPSIKEIRDEDVPKIPRADTTTPPAPAAQAAAKAGQPPQTRGR